MKSANFFLFTTLVIFFIYPGESHASGNVSMPQNLKTEWGLEQNMGQLKDPTGKELKDIQYFGSKGGVQIYCRAGSLSFVFLKNKSNKTADHKFKDYSFQTVPESPVSLEASRIDMVFSGANPGVKILAENKTELVKNYAGASGKFQGIASYKKLTWMDIYPHIDMELRVKEQGLEYRFIVHPGGDPKKIVIERKGMETMEMLKDGGIKYATRAGILSEGSPRSFTGKKTVSSSFIKKGNSVSFKLDKFDAKKDLVIDPDITWASYSGGDDVDETYGITTDGSGNVYIVGTTLSTSGIASTGAYQTSGSGASGYYDAYIMKLNSSGVPQWGTYFGGGNSDVGIGIALDNKNNIYITGYTNSFSGIATTGAYQTSLGGGSGSNDAFLAKFSNSGAIIWSTYFGGAKEEDGYRITMDAGNNPVITGRTAGSTGLATTGAFQTSYGGGSYDGFVAKFNGAGSLIWASYIGMAGSDYGYGVAADADSNVYVSGYSVSGSGLATAGSYQSSGDSLQGDAILIKFDSIGHRVWGTYYGGEGGDIALCASSQPSGNVVITGYTNSKAGMATSGAYQTALSGTVNNFVANFDASGKMVWSTYYGGEGDDEAYGLYYDNTGNIYVAGYTTSTTGIATSSGNQTAFNKNSDAFFAKFSSSGALNYGTYYGGSGDDAAQSICIDYNGNIYMAGYTTSSAGMATSGAYNSTYLGGYVDGFVAKFFICNLTTTIKGKDSACIGSSVSYKAASHPNSAYEWTVNGGTILSGAGTDSIVVQWTAKNSGTVKVKEVNSVTGCRDSILKNIVINALPLPGIIGSENVCGGDTITYHSFSIPGNINVWTVSGGYVLGSKINDSIVVKWPLPGGLGEIIINETSAEGCMNKDSTDITISPGANAKWKVKDNGNGSYIFSAIDSSVAIKYSWNVGDNGKGFGSKFIYNYMHDGNYKVELIASNGHCINVYDSTIRITNAGIKNLNGWEIGLKIYPNPFNSSTEISYNLPYTANVKISLYDILGRKEVELLAGKIMAGNHTCTLDANRELLAPGTYILKIQIDDAVIMQQVMKMRN